MGLVALGFDLNGVTSFGEGERLAARSDADAVGEDRRVGRFERFAGVLR